MWAAVRLTLQVDLTVEPFGKRKHSDWLLNENTVPAVSVLPLDNWTLSTCGGKQERPREIIKI